MENREARLQSELEVGKLSSEMLSRAGSSAGVEPGKREPEWGCKRGLTSRGKRRTEAEDKRGGTGRNVQGFKKGKASITFLDLDNIHVSSLWLTNTGEAHVMCPLSTIDSIKGRCLRAAIVIQIYRFPSSLK